MKKLILLLSSIFIIGCGSGIIIPDGIWIHEEPLVALTEYDETVKIISEPSVPIYIEENDIIIEENDIIIEIIEEAD